MDEVEVREMTRPQKQGNTEDLQIRQTHLPDLGGGEEQTAIAAVFSDMDIEIAALERRQDPRRQAGHDAAAFHGAGMAGQIGGTHDI